MKHENDMNNIPAEVWVVRLWQRANQPVGLETYNKISAIIDKYPAYFPWEHAYKKIPKEVHEGFKRECYPELYELLESPVGPGKGIMSEINIYTPQKFTLETIRKAFKDMEAHRVMQEKREIEINQIWDKHYKKYRLPYRKNTI